ncbi:MAG: (E)-4-hydroxy-3-methylbut-2-enyl-diphosphate synthase [Treponema sp.]|jgi:(E)-4-hydroxy-3-methylbut-2-enyl-diphosphate synthase|nr:(E)-4-hydroxy-3-methylbut-2-enyl-diphosphate synthase [Treponema sp.]
MSDKTRAIRIGGFDHVRPVFIGGGGPVIIQTMWKDRLAAADLEGPAGEEILARIDRLSAMGCGLLRFAVPDLEAAEVLGELASRVSLPLTADIHFDYRIALRCLDFPIAKIRLNPGNIGGRGKVEAVLDKAAAKNRPIRIGVNAGSLPQDLRLAVEQGKTDRHAALVEAAARELAVFREFGFRDGIVSIKASGVADTIKANRLFAEREYSLGEGTVPLHVGVTEAGPLVAGVVRNTAALLDLLGRGIGDTIRVSLSDSMEHEVIAAREILGALTGIRAAPPGLRIVSCPRCGRSSFDTHGFTSRWLSRLYSFPRDATVAVMGCVVNGPGEARDADLGITGAGDRVLLFRRGVVIRNLRREDADAAFAEELEKL